MLRRQGMRVETARDGREAVNKAKQEEFDLALLDIEMPGLSGDDAAQQIRTLEKFACRRIPILAVTSLASKSAIRRAASADMDGVLIKPVDERQLKEVIEGFMSSNPPPCDE